MGATKDEIPWLREARDHPAGRTVTHAGSLYRWYDRYLRFGAAGLEDHRCGPGRVWNRIPDTVRDQIVELALEKPALSPRELAVRFTDTTGYFVSESSV